MVKKLGVHLVYQWKTTQGLGKKKINIKKCKKKEAIEVALNLS